MPAWGRKAAHRRLRDVLGMKYWERAEKELRESDMTFRAISEIVFGFGSNVFFEYNTGGRIHKLTYSDIYRRAATAAQRIAELPDMPQKGAFVGIMLENSPEWVVAFWALLMAGRRPLIVNMKLDVEAVRTVLARAGATAVVAAAPFGDCKLLDIAALSSGGEPADTEFDWANEIALCTSGTSGIPKLCIYDGRVISAQILNSSYVMRCNPTMEYYYNGQCKHLAFLPFYHMFGLVAVLMWFSLVGRTFVLLRDMAPSTVADACKRHGVTHIFAVPVLFDTAARSVREAAKEQGQAEKLEKALALSIKLQTAFPRLGKSFVCRVMMKNVRRAALGEGLRYCITGGGFVSKDALYVMNGLGYSLYNGFGMTEAGITSVELRMKAAPRLTGSIGKPFPSAEYAIAGGGDRGELLVRGPSLNAAVIDGDGRHECDCAEWFHTGDSAYIDGGGNYYLEGRMDDMIVTAGGENIFPDELEAAFSVKNVRRACVLGLEPPGEQTVTLVVELEPGATPMQRARALADINAVNAALPMFERARRVLISGEPLPVALEMKLRRGVVREGIRSGAFKCCEADMAACRDGEALERRERGEILERMLTVFAAEFPDAGEITPSTHLIYDLKCESLKFFELIARISAEFNVTLTADSSACFTPQDFAAFVASKIDV